MTSAPLPVQPAPLSVQLYTVRRELADDFDGTLDRIAGMGFVSVEPYGLVEHAEALAQALPVRGLRAPSAHASVLGADLATVIDAALRVGVSTVIEPHVDPTRWADRAGVEALAAELTAVAARAADRGIRIGYHNHEFELTNRIDGVAALEVFADALGPDVLLEVDTYWAAVGGEDVPALLGRLGDRVAFLHVKDGPQTMDDREQVAVGSGTMPVADIIAAAPRALPVVELDDTAGDVFAAVEESRRFLLAGPLASGEGRS